MANFSYRARSLATGRRVGGSAEAETARDLVERLRQAGYVPLAVRAEGWLPRLSRRLKQLEPLGPKDRAMLYRQLATMLQAGLPLVTALEVLTTQGRGGGHEAARAVHWQILRGATLAEGMRQSGVGFPAVHVNLIRAGELSGHLDEVLGRLAVMEEKDAALRGKVRSAMLYPTVVLLVAVAVLIFMLMVVVPTFSSMFAELEAELPPLTRWLLGAISGAQERWYLILGGLVAAVLALRGWLGTPGGRRTWDGWLLRLPVLGRLSTNLLLGSMGRTMATLLSSGLTLLQALEAAGDAAGNAVYRRAMAEVSQGINRGESLAETMKWTGVMPSFVVEMVRVGEQSGSLEAMFGKIADYYDRQADEMATNLTALLEPLMLLLVGGAVAFILVSLFMPILTLLNAVDGAF